MCGCDHAIILGLPSNMSVAFCRTCSFTAGFKSPCYYPTLQLTKDLLGITVSALCSTAYDYMSFVSHLMLIFCILCLHTVVDRLV